MKSIIKILSFISFFILTQNGYSKSEIRAVWYNVYQINTSNISEARGQIDMHFRAMKEMGINRVFFLVKNPNGRVYYKSKILKPILNNDFVTNNNSENNWDVLEYVIKKSKENNMKIYPYLNVFAESGYFLKENPEYAEKNREGKKYEWVSPAINEVKNRMIDITEEIVKNYEIDGIQLDRVRYENVYAGFNETSIKLYREKYGKEPDIKDSDFIEYRKNLITEFVEELYKRIKNIKPDIEVSAAVFHSPKTAENVLQDWKVWAEKGILDYVYTMSYTNNENSFQVFLNDNIGVFKDKNLKTKLVIGVGAYYKNMTPEILSRQIKEVYRTNEAEGVCYFSFYNMIEDDFYKLISSKDINIK